MKLRHLTSALLGFFLISCGAAEQEPAAGPSVEQQRQLESLGYVTVVPVPKAQEKAEGVTRYDPTASHDGLNLFNSREQAVARLMTMDGREVHRWASDVRGRDFDWFLENLPSHVPVYFEGWNHIELLDDGDLLVIGTHHMLARLDWNSNLEWKLDISAHHDVCVSSDGKIYVLTDGIRTTELEGETVTFQDNYVVVLSPEGEIERRISVFDAFATGKFEELLLEPQRAIEPAEKTRLEFFREKARLGDDEDNEILRLYEELIRGDIKTEAPAKNLLIHGRTRDLFHTNSLQVLESDVPGLWRRGDLLLSFRKLDTIAVIDHESGQAIWTWGGGVLEAQHHATYLDDGTILIFDNGARQRYYSRILKIDPRIGEIVWEYTADPKESFYSLGRGGVQELPNGNFLIAETDTGRAFEISPDGEIVWEYYNEILFPEKQEKERGAIYRMTRIDPSALPTLSLGSSR